MRDATQYMYKLHILMGGVKKHRGCPKARAARRQGLPKGRLAEKVQVDHGALMAAKRECSMVSALTDLDRSPCILPAALKTRSTPAEEAGAARYCFTILHKLVHSVSFACHHFSAAPASSSSLLSPCASESGRTNHNLLTICRSI